jgi:hypothetical protein
MDPDGLDLVGVSQRLESMSSKWKAGVSDVFCETEDGLHELHARECCGTCSPHQNLVSPPPPSPFFAKRHDE